MKIRPYDPERDFEAACRIWREVSWLEKGQEDTFRRYVECGRAYVAELEGQAECLVTSATGAMRYLDEDLSFATPTGVAASRLARKGGLATRTTARVIAEDAAAGAIVQGIWIFEQGFYNRLGFGNGAYEITARIDPDQLRVDPAFRTPQRLTTDDLAAVHASRNARRLGHGGITVDAPDVTELQMVQSRNGFGLGYRDDDGAVTHHAWFGHEGHEQGPYHVNWLAYRTGAQLLELLALVKSLGDQVKIVSLLEPRGIQLQDLLTRPFRRGSISRRSEFETRIRAIAYWQMRMCDVPACLARTHLPGGEARFNLVLTDPIEAHLDDDAPWRGTAGEYVVCLGPTSSAQPGKAADLPTLTASVGALTRLWLGIRPATGLAVTDDLAGPADLLAQLDQLLRLPDCKPDWDF